MVESVVKIIMESLLGSLSPADRVHFVGIKGTGVCALAELMYNMGFQITGSDTAEIFYTDEILKELGIPYYESFDPAHISGDIALLIYSAAYSPDNNPEITEAVKKNIPVLSYPEALGMYSAAFDSTGIAGVHGKTTTTAICGCLADGLGLPVQVLAGSAVTNFGGKSTLIRGNRFFMAETCEYRKHFLFFHPKRVILTAVESDHQDFFPDYESIRDAFTEYCRLIPSGGELIYCADDPGACDVVRIIESEGRGIIPVPYGFTAEGDYQIKSYRVENEKAFFTINAFNEELVLCIPGRHQALNAAAAIALSAVLKNRASLSVQDRNGWNDAEQYAVKKALEQFRGSKRRAEIIGNSGGILFMDDYGHHPTAIKTTFDGLKKFYPSKRLVVSFMSHTYTRTAALLDEFACSLAEADVLFLHKIYSSARENFNGSINGMSIFDAVKNISGGNTEVYYTDEPMEAAEQLKKILKPGDLFLTLGAGSNWPLGLELYKYYCEANGVFP